MTEDALPARPVSAPPPAGPDNQLWQLFDLSPFPAVVSRLRDHTVLAINQRTSEVVGISQRDAVGVPVTDYYVDPAERTAPRGRALAATDARTTCACGSNERPASRFWVIASLAVRHVGRASRPP